MSMSSNLHLSIINHLFLPHDLPSSDEDDHLIASDRQNEYKLVECVSNFLQSLEATNGLPIFSTMKKCLNYWATIQNRKNCSVPTFKSTIQKLIPGDFLPIYFYAQNAAVLIEIDENNIDQPLISSWQVSLPIEIITSSLQPHLSCFPVPVFRLSNRSQLLSRTHCELLVDLMTNTIEQSKVQKSSYSFDEKRDVPISHYVCQWYIRQFQDIEKFNKTNRSFPFNKKHRDQIRFRNSYRPFRRSGLWMTIKVVLHNILLNHFGSSGTIVYKLLITQFLIYCIQQGNSLMNYRISSDLLVHCLRKVVRRLNKIECNLCSPELNGLNKWIKTSIDEIKKKTAEITPDLNWERCIEKQVEQKYSKMKFNSDFNAEVYHHACNKLKSYIKQNQPNEYSTLNNSYSHFSWLNNYGTVHKDIDKPEVQSIIIEMKVRKAFEQWLAGSGRSDKPGDIFKNLQDLYEEYQNAALKQYYSENESIDPMGYSRFILTSLTIIYLMHGRLCADERFERLKLHAIQIPNLFKIFEFLILPTRSDMVLARVLYIYFEEFSKKSYPDLLSDIKSENAFGVYFADRSTEMNANLKRIQNEVDLDRKAKTDEVNKKKGRYEELMRKMTELKCECDPTIPYKKCQRCTIEQTANKIAVDIYECPIPSDRESALAVLFELQMPNEIRCFRDVLWQFINRPNPKPTHNMHEWLKSKPHQYKLSKFYTGSHDSKVKLVSWGKSISESHYSVPQKIASTPLDAFFYENSLLVQISPTRPTELEKEHRALTPQIADTNYKCLQFSIDSTDFVQNKTIAELSKCPLQLERANFIEFGSFRSGHRLQWWNLLSVLESDSLPMDEESVAILITHSILQNGPISRNSKGPKYSWCPESHEPLLEDHFVDELISRLERHLKDNECNWQSEMILVIVTMISTRMFAICNEISKEKTTNLVLKCRNTGNNWIRLILQSLQNPHLSDTNKMDTLRDKIGVIGIASLLTYSIYMDGSCVALSDDDAMLLLEILTTVHDNFILKKQRSTMSVFMRNLNRYVERILVMIHQAVNQLFTRDSYKILNEFVQQHWAVIRTKKEASGQWKKRSPDMSDSWYDGQYGSNKVSIELFSGKFVVNDKSVSFLPDKITSDKIFQRVFGQHVFEVQGAKLEDTYITKYAYYRDEKVHYEFSCRNYQLRIYEYRGKTNARFELIPHDYFAGELPEIFVTDYSHWWNDKTNTLEFRPVSFQHEQFLQKIEYILTLEKGYIMTRISENRQFLVSRSSNFFMYLFQRYFSRLDDEPYVYILGNQGIFNIHLVRLGIAFKFNVSEKRITSREYPDMYIDENQCFGTLTGLISGILLSPIAAMNNNERYAVWRKLIVPYGKVNVNKTSEKNHQTVAIERKSPEILPFLHNYFVFILNDRLRVLQPTDSPTGWLYLALLHALTSNCLPDRYTGMTGMERAFQLLNSAGCWSDQPFDSICRQILFHLAKISPQVNYYPEHLQCMKIIEWSYKTLPCSLQHFGYFLLAKKLLEASEEWNFMHPTNVISKDDDLLKLFQNKSYNETLLRKLYWDYRDSYNPLVRLPLQMEDEISRAYSISSYQPVWKSNFSGGFSNFFSSISSLYGTGDVNLKNNDELRCFPLSHWLSSEYQLKNIWIGLFKLVEELKTVPSDTRQDDFERFELLIDFLAYIGNDSSNQQHCLGILKSAIKAQNVMLRSVPYPPFVSYEDIEQTSFHRKGIKVGGRYPYNTYCSICDEIENSFNNNSDYKNTRFPEKPIPVYMINALFKKWRQNKNLRSFITHVQSNPYSLKVASFNDIDISCQKFFRENFLNHHQIEIKVEDTAIQQMLLKAARCKFTNNHSDYFIKPVRCARIENESKKFPEEIFPSADDETNPFSNIIQHFKQHLTESWKHFNMVKEYQKKYPPLADIKCILESLREESRLYWEELKTVIVSPNHLLFITGLALRFLPMTLLSTFYETWLSEREGISRSSSMLCLNFDQCALLGGIMVNWVVEQQLERALHFAYQNNAEAFEKEMSNVPHVNWAPSEHLSWLILELEMNITIREVQVDVARHMTQPILDNDDSQIRNTVMQLNMGEGKTSVIVPMLALSLCSSSSSLVRIIVLKSLFPTNYQSLRYKLGGLLNRRVLPFSCRRDMNFTQSQADKIFNRIRIGLNQRDVILTAPEDILSFDLLTIDKCRRNEFNIGRSMLSAQRWIKEYVRDVLDESDEILHTKYQLIYSVGDQKQVDGGLERWKTIQLALSLVKQHAESIARLFNDDITYKVPERKSSFPEFRLLTYRPFEELCKRIARDWLNQKNFRQSDEQLILSFILDSSVPITCLNNLFPSSMIQLFLIMRGLLSSEVLFVTLKKRFRVNFGVNPNGTFNRLMAVPFRAKDVAAENTEFGHPDVALVLTQISYYYSGLSDSQLRQCFDRLSQSENDPDVIYNEWIALEEDDESNASIKQWKQINLKDKQQRTERLFPTFRRNMHVINYFLNNFVFPRESKQFPSKLVASPWDLSASARTKLMTGFSGTNDTQLLLPVHIRQRDLPALRETDAIVINNLLQSNNEYYKDLRMSASSEEILKEIVNFKPTIQVILDVGALLIDGNNHQIAIKWLDLSDRNDIDYVVYFEKDTIFVSDRQYKHHEFSTSPASERLDRCVFYLDEIHTRGTDFKFPDGFRAAVTLGNGLTKDRLVQACMRMRKLGKSHFLSFWSSNEVHHRIQSSMKTSVSCDGKKRKHDIGLIDILRWVYGNTQQAIWDGLHHWATQSLSFQNKLAASRDIDWKNLDQDLTNPMMEQVANGCLEGEILALETMYGQPKTYLTVHEIYLARYRNYDISCSEEIHQAVSKRLVDYGGSKKLLTQLLDEEQQRELEREQETEEERQPVRPALAVPCKPILHDAVMDLCEPHSVILKLSKVNHAFCPIADTFMSTSLHRECQPSCWPENMWVTTEFKRVVETRGELLDHFLRPPRWVLVYRNQHIILLSPYEANEIMGRLQYLHYNSPSAELIHTTLRLLLPRTRQGQSILLNTWSLTMPPMILPVVANISCTIPLETLVALFTFNGTIYFENTQEQDAYCKFLGLCLKPRNEIEAKAFDNGWISIDGFVLNRKHRQLLKIDQCRFTSNPLAFIRKLNEIRNYAHPPLSSHVGSIVTNAIKIPIN